MAWSTAIYRRPAFCCAGALLFAFLHAIVRASTATYRDSAHFGVQALQIAVLQSFAVLGDI